MLLEENGYGSSAPTGQQNMKDAVTKMRPSKRPTADMRPEYDFSGRVRGKYVDRYRRGTNVVLLAPELLEVFPDSKSVNDALRSLLAIATRAENRNRSYKMAQPLLPGIRRILPLPPRLHEGAQNVIH